MRPEYPPKRTLNTDQAALNNCLLAEKFLLGPRICQGRPAGVPALGQRAAAESRAGLMDLISGTDRLVLVKSCPIQPDLELAAQSARGVIDADFCRITAATRYSIDLVSKTESSRLRRLLRTDASSPSGT